MSILVARRGGSDVRRDWKEPPEISKGGQQRSRRSAAASKLLLRNSPHWAPGAVKADWFDVVLKQLTLVDERNKARERAEKAASKAPKLPSEKFIFAHGKWLIIAGVDDEQDLPQLYHDLANVQKGDLRPPGLKKRGGHAGKPPRHC